MGVYENLLSGKDNVRRISICAHVPVAWIRISPPKQYTEEQRQQMGERMRQNRSENTATQG